MRLDGVQWKSEQCVSVFKRHRQTLHAVKQTHTPDSSVGSCLNRKTFTGLRVFIIFIVFPQLLEVKHFCSQYEHPSTLIDQRWRYESWKWCKIT